MSWNLWTLAGKGAIFLLLWSLFKRNHNNLFQKVRDKIEDLGTYSQQGDQVLQSPYKAKYSGQRSSIRILSLRSGWDWSLFILTNTGGSYLSVPAFVNPITVIPRHIKPIQVGKVSFVHFANSTTRSYCFLWVRHLSTFALSCFKWAKPAKN